MRNQIHKQVTVKYLRTKSKWQFIGKVMHIDAMNKVKFYTKNIQKYLFPGIYNVDAIKFSITKGVKELNFC